MSEVKSLSCVRLFAAPWTVAYQAPLSMGFSRQEYWSGLPFPSPGDLPHPGIKPRSPASQADALPSEPPGSPSWLRSHNFVTQESAVSSLVRQNNKAILFYFPPTSVSKIWCGIKCIETELSAWTSQKMSLLFSHWVMSDSLRPHGL